MLIQAYQAARMKVSVAMNGLFIPFNRCPDNLARFCRPLLFHNDHEYCDLSISGSSFLIRFRQHNFLLCSRHQLGQEPHHREPNEIVIAINDPNGIDVALTSNEAIQIKVPSADDENAEDLLILRYESQRGTRDISKHFLQWDIENVHNLDDTQQDKIVAIFTIGYMTTSTDYEPVYNEDSELIGTKIVSRWSKLYLRQTAAGTWLPNLRIGLEVHENQRDATVGTLSYDPDGFSGSPVIFIFRDDNNQHHLGFAGLITHADKFGRFAIYPAKYICQAILQAVNTAGTT